MSDVLNTMSRVWFESKGFSDTFTNYTSTYVYIQKCQGDTGDPPMQTDQTYQSKTYWSNNQSKTITSHHCNFQEPGL